MAVSMRRGASIRRIYHIPFHGTPQEWEPAPVETLTVTGVLDETKACRVLLQGSGSVPGIQEKSTKCLQDERTASPKRQKEISELPSAEHSCKGASKQVRLSCKKRPFSKTSEPHEITSIFLTPAFSLDSQKKTKRELAIFQLASLNSLKALKLFLNPQGPQNPEPKACGYTELGGSFHLFGLLTIPNNPGHKRHKP